MNEFFGRGNPIIERRIEEVALRIAAAILVEAYRADATLLKLAGEPYEESVWADFAADPLC